MDLRSWQKKDGTFETHAWRRIFKILLIKVEGTAGFKKTTKGQFSSPVLTVSGKH